MTAAYPTGAPRPPGLARTLAFSLPGVALGSYAVAFSVYLPQYFASHIGIATAVTGNAFAIVRFIDIWLDPFIGMGMDHTRTRIGRYRLWMLLGAPIFALAAYMIYMVQPGATVQYVIAWLLVFYIGTSVMSLSHTSWASVLAPTYDARSRLFGAMASVGVVGAAVVLLLPKILGVAKASDPHLLHTMGWFMIAAAPAGAIIAALATPERLIGGAHHQPAKLIEYLRLLRRPEVLRILGADLCLALGPGWMAAIYLYFFRESRGFTAGEASLLLFIYTMAGLVGAWTLGRLAVSFGKHRTLMAASTGYSIGLAVIFILPKGHFFVDAPFMFVMGFLASGFTLLIRAMVADVGDQVRLETGRNQIGLLYALVTGTQKLAGAFSIALTFNALALVGYQTKEGIRNSAAAIHGLELIYLIGPISFVMLGGACFIGYRLDAAKHAEIRRELEERDALVPEAAVIEAMTSDAALSDAEVEPPRA
ncbi:MAG TPA: MFS transporter [Caulobacteraceae bacterium]|nr:MFS transporter [Caulobacteraceae bacterium]